MNPATWTLRSSKTKPAIRAATAHVMLPMQITRGAGNLCRAISIGLTIGSAAIVSTPTKMYLYRLPAVRTPALNVAVVDVQFMVLLGGEFHANLFLQISARLVPG